MKTIYKYPLEIVGDQHIELPALAEILTVQIQSGKPVLWALVDTNASPVMRSIECFGTGNPIGAMYERRYISTIQTDNGLVFHFFETIF